MAGTTDKPKADAEKEAKEEVKPEEVKKPLTIQQGVFELLTLLRILADSPNQQKLLRI